MVYDRLSIDVEAFLNLLNNFIGLYRDGGWKQFTKARESDQMSRTELDTRDRCMAWHHSSSHPYYVLFFLSLFSLPSSACS